MAGNEVTLEGGPDDEGALRERLAPGATPPSGGQHVVPASVLADPDGRAVTSLTLEFTAPGEGRFLSPVRKGSLLSVRRKVVLRVDVGDPQRP